MFPAPAARYLRGKRRRRRRSRVMARRFEVALIVDPSKPYDRRIIRGVAEYVRRGRCDWSLYVEEDPVGRLPHPSRRMPRSPRWPCRRSGWIGRRYSRRETNSPTRVAPTLAARLREPPAWTIHDHRCPDLPAGSDGAKTRVVSAPWVAPRVRRECRRCRSSQTHPVQC